MLVEIPDPEVILSVVAAFLVGVFGLYLYYKVKPFVNLKPKSVDPTYFERLEYYERQLIDLKIRLDSLEIDDLGTKSQETNEELKEIVRNLAQKQEEPKVQKKIETPKVVKEDRVSNFGYVDVIDHVLRLITDKPMTSRDIQITIGRTREHTSRLMKKLYDDGFVQRNTKSKPYTYSITDKGKEKLGMLQTVPPSS